MANTIVSTKGCKTSIFSASLTKQLCLDYIRGPEMPHNKGYIFCTTLRDPINVTCVVKAEEVMHPLPNEGFHYKPQP